MKMFVGFIFLYLMVLSTSCNKSEDGSSPWVIKSYKTDSSQGDGTVKTLNKLLNPDPVKTWVNKGDHSEEEVSRTEPSRGVARLAGAGLIAVNTSEEIHKGIPELIAQIDQSKARPLTELQTEGWLLVALPSSKKVPLPTALQDKLSAFDIDYPGRCIVEVDHFLLRSIEGKEFRIKGDHTKVKGYVMMAGDNILADIKFEGKLLEFESQVISKPSEAMVISQASRHGKTLPKEVLEQCGIAADTPLDLQILVALKSSLADSK
jgi:hypothetical protein